jgi:hypothetical protein
MPEGPSWAPQYNGGALTVDRSVDRLTVDRSVDRLTVDRSVDRLTVDRSVARLTVAFQLSGGPGGRWTAGLTA